MSQPMNPTSNVDFSHDAYMNEYKQQKFHGYKGHLQYLDYFVKTDVAKRDGEGHHAPKKPMPKKEEAPAVGVNNGGEEVKAQQQLQEQQVQVQNKPLIIAGDEGCGKTALISHWLNHSPLFQQKHTKHQVLLVHVAGASSCERKYQSFIHRALVKLRRAYPDVQTRLVHIIDDKLRINFSRCLDLVSNSIGSTTSSASTGTSSTGADNGDTDRDGNGGGGSGSSSGGRIIMVLDGLENFKDSENEQGVDSEQSADWVPWSFPDHFRVIILTRKRSKAMNHFKLRKCPLLYMGDQIHFNAGEISNIITEHVNFWQPTLTGSNVDSFEGRLQIIKNELVAKREQIFKEQQRTQRQQRELQSEDQIITIKTLEEELAEGNFHLLAKPADEYESKFAKPTERQLNPLIIRSILCFYLYCGSSSYTGPQGLRPLDMKIILGCKTLHQLFVTALKHFRDCMFTNQKNHGISTPISTSSKFQIDPKNQTGGSQHQTQQQIAEQGKEKFDQLLSYIFVSRKGITWSELKELIPSLTEDDIRLFQDVFGFLLIRYSPDHHSNMGTSSLSGGVPQQTFVFYKHASFKKAIKETIEPLKNEQTRAQLHKNLATLIEKQEPVNQFLWQRRVDELCYHYQMSGMWIKLKDLISSVEVFSTMFVVPELRYELAQQWLWLLGQQQTGGSGGGASKSGKQQCDPVVEYNKALESFIIKYRPTSKELFVIMIQLCRFFKEDLAELVSGAEASEPQFAHPPLLGTREMESIRLLREVERLDSLYIPDREGDQIENNKLVPKSSSKLITTSSQLIASLKGFNLDNAIVREQIIDMIRKEVFSQNQAKEHQMISMIDEDSTTHYHYKRWLWVQFPWCTIDVHADISNIMELFSGGGSKGDSSMYISATKENELAKATLQILYAAKQRSKKSYATGNKSFNQSQASSVNQTSFKKKGGRKSGNTSIKHKQGMLPPVVPASAKNHQSYAEGNQSLSMSKTMGNRSISASRAQRDSSFGRLPMLRLDSDDRRSPEKTLAKISVTMAVIEQGKMKEIEQENVTLGAQLNNLNFMIYRKEKELKQLDEHYTALMVEHSVNSEGQHKLEVMEAKLLHAYEDLNRVEVERKRIEQIVKACEKNPPNNEEQIRNLEQQIDVFMKLISYHQGLMTSAHKEQEIYKKQYTELMNEMQKLENDRTNQIHKIHDVIERKRKLEILMTEGNEERKNFALFPVERNEIDVGILKQRQAAYKKWKSKLNVTKAFISEKRLMYENSFRKMIEIAGLRKVETSQLLHKENPLQNLEGLIAFIERANDLDKSKRQKESKIEQLKRHKEELLAELKKWENGVQLIECGHVERAQKKLYLEDKQLRQVKDYQQRQLSLIADLKSGFVNVAKILGIEEGLETESDQSALIDKICERFQRLEAFKNGSKLELANSDALSADRNNLGLGSGESHRSRQEVDGNNQMLSPQGNRQRKKQPKQKQPGQADSTQVKHSPTLGAGALNSANQNSSLPMKLVDFRDNDVDSETEERQQIQQDRMRLKKNLSINGNYTLSKVQTGGMTTPQNAGTLQAPGTADASETKARSASQGLHKPNFNSSVEKFKKSNLTASNPIIGAPLGDKSRLSVKELPKLQAGGGLSGTLKGASSISKLGTVSQMSKPSLAQTSKIPKYVKKTIKFAKGVEGGLGDGPSTNGEM